MDKTLNFDALYQPYASIRYPISAKRGMVCTGNALASGAGLRVMQAGGNAIDAAIATAAALTVVEPTANGLGSDAFALVWVKDKLYGLNASGKSPAAISIEKVRQDHEQMPTFGWTPVTVPGAIDGWVKLHERFGRLPFEQVLAPAIELAQDGFVLGPVTAHMWERSVQLFTQRFGKQRAYQEWFRTFTKDGESRHFGEVVQLPNHAKTLRLIAQSKGRAFYEGEIAQQLVAQSQRDGGYFSLEDLASYQAEWVDPISVNYHGVDVYEIPPNGQGLVALMALNALDKFDLPFGSTDYVHAQFEAMKLAFAQGKHSITDACHMKENLADLLSDRLGQQWAEIIGDKVLDYGAGKPHGSGTVYLCTADDEGNMVSFIQSNYMGFGSGIVVEGYGVSLQNRGADFSLNRQDVNALAPGKRTYHTIIPGFLARGSQPIGPFGVMGGYMQPQGHVQVVTSLVDGQMNPQMALDKPRWQWMEDKRFLVEPHFDMAIANQLARKGHQIEVATNGFSFGRGQMIIRLDNGILVGGCESRTDSNIACW